MDGGISLLLIGGDFGEKHFLRTSIKVENAKQFSSWSTDHKKRNLLYVVGTFCKLFAVEKSVTALKKTGISSQDKLASETLQAQLPHSLEL